MRLPVWRQRPIYGHFLSAGWAVGSTCHEHRVSFSCVEHYKTDGVTDRASERLRNRGWEMKRQKERCMESGLADIDHCIWQELSCYC